MGYVYIEYPKCLYDTQGNTMTVDNREEEDAAAAMGWMDAAKKHDYPVEVVGDVVTSVDGGSAEGESAEEPTPVVEEVKTPSEFDEGF